MSLGFEIFFTFFIAVQLYAWMYIPTYDQSVSEDYIDMSDPRNRDAYEIPLDHFLPMVGIAEYDPATWDTPEATFKLNDRKIFDIKWIAQYGIEEKVLESISCRELIDSWTHLMEKERSSFKRMARLWRMTDGTLYDFYMCPNVKHIEVRSFLMDNLDPGMSELRLRVGLTAAGKLKQSQNKLHAWLI